MKATRSTVEFTRLPKGYAELCRLLMPRPLRDKVDLENVTGMTDALAGHKLTADQEDFRMSNREIAMDLRSSSPVPA